METCRFGSGDRGTHTLIRKDERNSLTKTRLASYGFTFVLATTWEVNFSWFSEALNGRILRKRKLGPKHAYGVLRFTYDS